MKSYLKRRWFVLTLLLTIVPLAFLFYRLPAEERLQQLVVEGYRLPRLGMAFLTGAVLTWGGILFQALLRNPLADPFILGLSSGAACGKMLWLLAAPPALSAFLAAAGEWSFALGGAFLSLVLVFTLARRRFVSAQEILLGGVVINAFFGSGVIALLQAMEPALFIGIKVWLSGVIPLPSPLALPVLAGLAFSGLAISLRSARSLDQISLGEHFAHSVGLDFRRFRRNILILATLVLAPFVVYTGIIGFVGLILPHLLRLDGLYRHSVLLPLGFLCGGLYLVLAEFLVYALQPTEQIFTVGALTAVIGAPLFLYLLHNHTRLERSA